MCAIGFSWALPKSTAEFLPLDIALEGDVVKNRSTVEMYQIGYDYVIMVGEESVSYNKRDFWGERRINIVDMEENQLPSISILITSYIIGGQLFVKNIGPLYLIETERKNWSL